MHDGPHPLYSLELLKPRPEQRSQQALTKGPHTAGHAHMATTSIEKAWPTGSPAIKEATSIGKPHPPQAMLTVMPLPIHSRAQDKPHPP